MDRSPAESHPSFGVIVVNRVSSTGTHLFDSELNHDHYSPFTGRSASVTWRPTGYTQPPRWWRSR